MYCALLTGLVSLLLLRVVDGKRLVCWSCLLSWKWSREGKALLIKRIQQVCCLCGSALVYGRSIRKWIITDTWGSLFSTAYLEHLLIMNILILQLPVFECSYHFARFESSISRWNWLLILVTCKVLLQILSYLQSIYGMVMSVIPLIPAANSIILHGSASLYFRLLEMTWKYESTIIMKRMKMYFVTFIEITQSGSHCLIIYLAT